MLFVSAVSAYLALNFTGSSTFTSLSGVKKEIRLSLPVIISAFVVSIITYIFEGSINYEIPVECYHYQSLTVKNAKAAEPALKFAPTASCPCLKEKREYRIKTPAWSAAPAKLTALLTR